MEIYRSELHSDDCVVKEILFVKTSTLQLEEVIRCIIWEIEPEYKSKSIVDIIEVDINTNLQYLAERVWYGLLHESLVQVEGEFDFGKATKPASKIRKVLEQFMQKEI